LQRTAFKTPAGGKTSKCDIAFDSISTIEKRPADFASAVKDGKSSGMPHRRVGDCLRQKLLYTNFGIYSCPAGTSFHNSKIECYQNGIQQTVNSCEVIIFF
jgi:hypothetical protein